MAFLGYLPLLQLAKSDFQSSRYRWLLPRGQTGRAYFNSQTSTTTFLLHRWPDDEYHRQSDQRLPLQLFAQLLGTLFHRRARPRRLGSVPATAVTQSWWGVATRR